MEYWRNRAFPGCSSYTDRTLNLSTPAVQQITEEVKEKRTSTFLFLFPHDVGMNRQTDPEITSPICTWTHTLIARLFSPICLLALTKHDGTCICSDVVLISQNQMAYAQCL